MDNNQGQELLESLNKIKKAMIKSHIIKGIPQPLVMAMRSIKHHNSCMDDEDLHGVKMSELSNFLNISRPATTQIVDALEKKGFVKRILSPNDRRAVYLCLTEEGNEILNKAEQEVFLMMSKIAESLGENDTAELIRIINKLSETLADIKSEIK